MCTGDNTNWLVNPSNVDAVIPEITKIEFKASTSFEDDGSIMNILCNNVTRCSFGGVHVVCQCDNEKGDLIGWFYFFFSNFFVFFYFFNIF